MWSELNFGPIQVTRFRAYILCSVDSERIILVIRIAANVLAYLYKSTRQPMQMLLTTNATTLVGAENVQLSPIATSNFQEVSLSQGADSDFNLHAPSAHLIQSSCHLW